MKIISIFSDPIFCIYECLCPIPTRGCGGEGGVEQRRNRLDIRGYRIDMTSPRRKRGHFYKNRNWCLNTSIMTSITNKRNNNTQQLCIYTVIWWRGKIKQWEWRWGWLEIKIISLSLEPILCLFECLCPIPTRGWGGLIRGEIGWILGGTGWIWQVQGGRGGTFTKTEIDAWINQSWQG